MAGMQQIPGLDLWGAYQAFDASKKDALQRNRMLEIGKAASTGDYAGAANKAFALGDLSTGTGLLNVRQSQKKFDAENHTAHLDHILGVLNQADTPEKWAQATAYLNANGEHLTTQEADFNHRQETLAQGFSLKDQLAQKNADRTFQQTQTNENRNFALKKQEYLNPILKPEGFQVIGEDQYGQKQYGYPPAPGAAPTNPNASGAVPVPQPMAPATPDVTGAAYLKTLDPKYARTIQSFIDGRQVLSPRLQSTPYGRKLISDITTVDSTYEQGNAQARSKLQTDLATGTLGKTNNKLNAAIEHSLQLSDAIDKMGNYDKGGLLDTLGLTTTANSIKNQYAVGGGHEAVTNFRAISGRLSEEMVAAYRNAGGNETDVLREMKNVADAGSPSQLHGALAKAAYLLESKIEANQNQVDTIMGPMATPKKMISDNARKALDILEKRASGAQDQNGPQAITTPEEYNALPSGTQFLAPDGTTRVKP
jgi:hypothetical protein